MADKMMKIAVRGEDGKAKSLKGDNDGRAEVRLEDAHEREIFKDLTINANTSEVIVVDTKRPYKAIIKKQNNYDEKWWLRKDVYLGGTSMPATGAEIILESNGESVVVGNGNRVNAFSDLNIPLGDKTQFVLRNIGDSGIFSFYLVEYPYGISEPSIVVEAQNNPDTPTTPEKTKENIHESFSTTSLNGTVTIFENSNETRLDYLEFSTNNINAQFFIEFRKEDGTYQPIGQIMADGSNVSGYNPRLIIEQGASIWSIMAFEDGKYKFSLKNELNFARGLRVRASYSTSTVNFACRFFGVEYID